MLGRRARRPGDGEIMGAAIETSFDISSPSRSFKGKKIDWPR